MTAPARARMTGAVYLLYFACALPLALRGAMIVPGNAAATAAHIAASETLYRLTLATDLLSYAIYRIAHRSRASRATSESRAML